MRRKPTPLALAGVVEPTVISMEYMICGATLLAKSILICRNQGREDVVD